MKSKMKKEQVMCLCKVMSTSEPQFTHDCKRCEFKGRGYYGGETVDWWVCPPQGPKDVRCLIARYGSNGPEYCSGDIAQCMEVTRLEFAALAQGLELLPQEKDKLLQRLLGIHFSQRSNSYWKDQKEFTTFHIDVRHPQDKQPLGDANWLDLDLWDEEKEEYVAGPMYRMKKAKSNE